MADHIIKSQNPEIGYYTGTGWHSDATKATRYPTKEVAEAVIRAFSMQATAVDAGGSQPTPPAVTQPQPQSQAMPQGFADLTPDDIANLVTAIVTLVTIIAKLFKH